MSNLLIYGKCSTSCVLSLWFWSYAMQGIFWYVVVIRAFLVIISALMVKDKGKRLVGETCKESRTQINTPHRVRRGRSSVGGGTCGAGGTEVVVLGEILTFFVG